MVIFPKVDGVIEEDDQQICADMDQLLSSEGDINLLCGFHCLYVNGLLSLGIDLSFYLLGFGIAESSHVRLNIDNNIVSYLKGLRVSW